MRAVWKIATMSWHDRVLDAFWDLYMCYDIDGCKRGKWLPVDVLVFLFHLLPLSPLVLF
jgi:hypothetical protein